MILPLERAC